MEGMRFGAWLRQELHRRNMKQTELAQRAGVSRSMISKLITQTEHPRKETMKKIIEALESQPVSEQHGNEGQPVEVYARRFSDLMKQMIDMVSEMLKAMESK